jgi:hypothetical protein
VERDKRSESGISNLETINFSLEMLSELKFGNAHHIKGDWRIPRFEGHEI